MALPGVAQPIKIGSLLIKLWDNPYDSLMTDLDLDFKESKIQLVMKGFEKLNC